MSNPFSFTEILQVPSFNHRVDFFQGADGCPLAYSLYAPKTPHAICIFYHGAGFYGNPVHQQIGKKLADKHNITAYIVDIRGHGNSGGARGDAPSMESVWADVSQAIKHAQKQFPHVPVYLAGHSSGAGLILNYAAWPLRKDVAGLILLAPYLGPKSGVQKNHIDPDRQFAKKLRSWAYLLFGISNGYFCAHTPAVYFNYPFTLFNDKKIVRYYTTVMSMATTPYEIEKVIASIMIPTAMMIASRDEQFQVDPLLAWANRLPKETKKYTEIIDTQHLTILLDGAELIQRAIRKLS